MKKEKKLIALSIFALAIGIATILPLSYLTLTNAIDQPQPFFTPYLVRAQAIPDTTTLYVEIDGTKQYHSTMNSPDEGSINTQVCYHITPYGADLKDVDAKIEVYNIHYYSDKGSILNMTQVVGIAGNVPDPSAPNGATPAFTTTIGYAHYDNPIDWANHKDTIDFADGTVYDVTRLFSYTESRAVFNATVEYYTNNDHGTTMSMAILSISKGENSAQGLKDLRNAETIYIDITRVMQITYKHPSSANPLSVITTTPITSNEVLCHIQLPKLDDKGRAMYESGHDEYIWADP
jgi:hypothetical protein